MMPALAGLWPPVATPFRADGAVDTARLVKHSRTLLADGAHGLAILGTTSEANSLTLDERRRVIDAHVEAGIEAARLIPGTGACAIDDAVALTRHAGEIGAAGGASAAAVLLQEGHRRRALQFRLGGDRAERIASPADPPLPHPADGEHRLVGRRSSAGCATLIPTSLSA